MANFPDDKKRGGTPFSDGDLAAGEEDLELDLDLELPRQKSVVPRPGTLYEGQRPITFTSGNENVPPSTHDRGKTVRPPAARSVAAMHPVRSRPDRSSLLMGLFLFCLLGVGAYGGYYGFCKYEVSTKVNSFSREVHDLRQILLNQTVTTRPEHVKTVVLDLARKTGVQVKAEQIEVTLEPLTTANSTKLNTISQTAIGIAAKMPRYHTPKWLVGFKVPVTATYGIAEQTIVASQYVWSDDAQP